MAKPLTNIQRQPLELVLDGITAQDEYTSEAAGLKLTREAKDHGLNLRDYLNLAVDVRNTKDAGTKFNNGQGGLLSGYEATLAELNLPFKNDFENGVTLQAAADTFAMTKGARGLFPEVIDDMLNWAHKQENFEKTDGLIANRRTIQGTELLTKIVEDDSDALNTFTVPELAQIPVETISSTDQAVKFYKHGSGIRFSYEFQRRVALDIVTPYAARKARQLEISKVRAATNVLLNGDGVNGAAAAEALSTYGADFSGGKTLKNNYVALMKFLTKRAQAGYPIDTVVGNLDTYLELFLMFQPNNVNPANDAAALQAKGAPTINLTLPFMTGVKFELSSAMPAGKLLCMAKGETLEELIESGGNIAESENAIRNQSIVYFKTEVTGYKIIYGNGRVLLDVTA